MIYILGAGISGTLTALALASHGIATVVLDRKTEFELEHPNDPRTTALTRISKNFLINIGVWEEFKHFSQNICDIFVCQNMANNILHMKEDEIELGLMIENNNFRKKLFEIAKKENLIKFHYNTYYENLELLENKVKFSYKKDGKDIKVEPELCIVADGRFSNARKEFFTNYFEKDYNQKAIVFNIKHSKNHEGGAIEHFLYRGSFATLPLKGGYSSSIVWVEDTKVAEFLLTQKNKDLEKLILQFIGGALGDIEITTRPEAFPLSAFVTQKYYKGNLVLIADSAHVVHPLAGQGLNMGIQDIIYLTDQIAKNLNLGFTLDEVMLKKYEKVRKIDNMLMLRITDSINTIFTHRFRPLNRATELGLSIVNAITPVKNFLVDYAKGRN